MYQIENNYNLRCDFGIRLAATLMDIFIICVLIFILFIFGLASFFTGVTISERFSSNSFASGAFVGGGIGVIFAMIGLIYICVSCYGLIEGITGASPGKRIVGLQIANENGIKGNVKLYLIRWAIKNIGNFLALTIFLVWIGNMYSIVIFIGCFAVLGEKRQAIHDMLAKTAVFRKKDIMIVENTII